MAGIPHRSAALRTIKAIQYTAVGGPEVIKVGLKRLNFDQDDLINLERQTNNVPFPVVQPNEMLIRVKYAGVNFIDTYYRTGVYPIKSYPWVAGSEASGVIERLPTDPAVLEDPEYRSRNYEIGQNVVTVSHGLLSFC